jgi:CRISPR/Cas system CMR subunit Cmr4 (Cas7 group RAMP superfamily)
VVAVKFEIQFHTPFRVATGRAGDGADSKVDRSALLPASSLKGIMRSAARDTLCLDPGWIDAVYGAAWSPSPWGWSHAEPVNNAQPDGTASTRLRARIQVTAETSTVTNGALAIAEEVLAHRATFTITRTGWIDKMHQTSHEQILLASARAVTALGGDRRRGLGWVSLTSVDPPWRPETADDLVASLHDLPKLEEHP